MRCILEAFNIKCQPDCYFSAPNRPPPGMAPSQGPPGRYAPQGRPGVGMARR